MDKTGTALIGGIVGLIVGAVISLVVILSNPPTTNTANNMVVTSVKIVDKGYEMSVTGFWGAVHTKHLYTVGDTIKLCN